MGGSGLEVSPGDIVAEGEAEERGGETGVMGMEDNGVVKTSAMGEPTGERGEGEAWVSRGILGSGGTGGAFELTENREDELCDASVF